MTRSLAIGAAPRSVKSSAVSPEIVRRRVAPYMCRPDADGGFSRGPAVHLRSSMPAATAEQLEGTGGADDASGLSAAVFSSVMELRASILAGILLAAGIVSFQFDARWFGTPLVWSSLAIGMVYGGRAALDALRERKFDIDVLMVLAAGAAAATGHPEDGALLLFLFVLSGALEDRAMRRTMQAVEALHKLMPTIALVWRGGDDGDWAQTDPQLLVAGERVRIRTGELIPTDARVVAGVSTIDQATLTGESIPRSVETGDEIYAGTLNLANPIEAVVTRPASESSLQKVLDLVISAQQQREPMQRLIDRFSQPYAIGVTVISISVFLVWWLVLGEPILDSRGYGAAYTAIALLIVGSPCALVIATPTATLAAISRAARSGLLFKGGQAIERLAQLGSVCMDKTGTLTRGRPRLHEVQPVGWSDGDAMLAVAAALEAGSTHPIAVAVVEEAASRGIDAKPAIDLTDLPGRGLSGIVEGFPARLGTYAHCEELVPTCLRARIQEVLERIRGRGQIGVVAAWADGSEPDSPDDHTTGGQGSGTGQAVVLVLSDEIRPGAKELVMNLHGLGIRPVRMLTGDNSVTAAYVAGQLGIDQWDAELLPEDKVRIVEEMKAAAHQHGSGSAAKHKRGVGVIGDGVNDAPALAAADVSIAIGSIGSDAALESADIVLLNDDLMVVPWAVRLARRARGIVMFNIALALSIIGGMGLAVLIGSRVGWDIPLPIAVLAHEGGTLLVVLNSLRLLLMAQPSPSVDAAIVAPVEQGSGLAEAAA